MECNEEKLTQGRESESSYNDLCSHHVIKDWKSRLCDGENKKVGPFINF